MGAQKKPEGFMKPGLPSLKEKRRCGSVYLGVVVLSVRDVCSVYVGYVGSAVVLYI